nr:hypothetical protein [Morchella crassipes]
MKVRWTRGASNPPLFHTPPTPPCLNRRDTHPPPEPPPHPLLRRWWGGSRGEGLLFYLNFALFKAKQVFISPPLHHPTHPPHFSQLTHACKFEKVGGATRTGILPPFPWFYLGKGGGFVVFLNIGGASLYQCMS